MPRSQRLGLVGELREPEVAGRVWEVPRSQRIIGSVSGRSGLEKSQGPVASQQVPASRSVPGPMSPLLYDIDSVIKPPGSGPYWRADESLELPGVGDGELPPLESIERVFSDHHPDAPGIDGVGFGGLGFRDRGRRPLLVLCRSPVERQVVATALAALFAGGQPEAARASRRSLWPVDVGTGGGDAASSIVSDRPSNLRVVPRQLLIQGRRIIRHTSMIANQSSVISTPRRRPDQLRSDDVQPASASRSYRGFRPGVHRAGPWCPRYSA